MSTFYCEKCDSIIHIARQTTFCNQCGMRLYPVEQRIKALAGAAGRTELAEQALAIAQGVNERLRERFTAADGVISAARTLSHQRRRCGSPEAVGLREALAAYDAGKEGADDAL